MEDNKKAVSLGLKETKEAVDFAISLGMAIDGALEDGKVSFTDIPLFLPTFIKLVPAIEGADQIPLEFKLATQEEIDELKEFIRTKLELRDEDLEKFIEDSFAVILTIWTLVKTYFNVQKPGSDEAQEIADAPDA